LADSGCIVARHTAERKSKNKIVWALGWLLDGLGLDLFRISELLVNRLYGWPESQKIEMEGAHLLYMTRIIANRLLAGWNILVVSRSYRSKDRFKRLLRPDFSHKVSLLHCIVVTLTIQLYRVQVKYIEKSKRHPVEFLTTHPSSKARIEVGFSSFSQSSR
jgi:hypothetical protein